jgi:hypothetical protein
LPNQLLQVKVEGRSSAAYVWQSRAGNLRATGSLFWHRCARLR